MSISQFLNEAITWLAWIGLALGLGTIIAFIVGWGFRFRLVGATVFTLLLSGSCWAFQESYTPPINIEGALYLPVVYDNGGDLVVAQAPEDFPKEAIKPSLEQIAANLKGGGRNGQKVLVRVRKIETTNQGVSQPIILSEVIKDNSINEVTLIPEEVSLSKNIFMQDDLEVSIPEENLQTEASLEEPIQEESLQTKDLFEEI